MNEIPPKLSNINKTPVVKPHTKENKPLARGQGSFDKILTRQIEKNPDHKGLKGAATLPEIGGSFKLQGLDLEFNQKQFTQKLTTSLNLFDQYASWLGDPGKTLKEANNLLEQVVAQTRALSREVKDDSTPSDELKQLLTQLTTLARVEQVKLNRGDYSN